MEHADLNDDVLILKITLWDLVKLPLGVIRFLATSSVTFAIFLWLITWDVGLCIINVLTAPLAKGSAVKEGKPGHSSSLPRLPTRARHAQG